MAKKVLRYTEDEFVTLLENIVKRVKKEQMIEESIKNRGNNITENSRNSNQRRTSRR